MGLEYIMLWGHTVSEQKKKNLYVLSHTQNLANNVKYLCKQICMQVQHNMKKTDKKRLKTRKGGKTEWS